MMMLTIDLDFYNANKLQSILNHLKKCKNVIELKFRKSSSGKGFHIKFFLKEFCWYCFRLKMRYDDNRRFYADFTNRTARERDVLFKEKSFIIQEEPKIEVRRYAKSWVMIK